MRKSPKRFYPLDLCSHRRGPIHATLARALQSLGSPAAPTPLHCIRRRCAIQARIRRHPARSEYLPSPTDASSRSLSHPAVCKPLRLLSVSPRSRALFVVLRGSFFLLRASRAFCCVALVSGVSGVPVIAVLQKSSCVSALLLQWQSQISLPFSSLSGFSVGASLHERDDRVALYFMKIFVGRGLKAN